MPALLLQAVSVTLVGFVLGASVPAARTTRPRAWYALIGAAVVAGFVLTTELEASSPLVPFAYSIALLAGLLLGGRLTTQSGSVEFQETSGGV